MATDDNNDNGAGRGMLGVSMDESGMVLIEHQETDKTFTFHRDDLEEVIDTLIDFRNQLPTLPKPTNAVSRSD